MFLISSLLISSLYFWNVSRVFPLALRFQQLKIAAQMLDGSIERRNMALCARLHHAAFHDRKHKLGQRLQIRFQRKPSARIFKKCLYGGSPAVKVIGQTLVHAELLLGNFERQPSDRAAIRATGSEQIAAIKLQDAEHALDGILQTNGNRVDDDGIQGLEIQLENRQQQLFLSLEKMIKAAGIRSGPLQDFGDSSSGIALKPEEIESGLDDALASFGSDWQD